MMTESTMDLKIEFFFFLLRFEKIIKKRGIEGQHTGITE